MTSDAPGAPAGPTGSCQSPAVAPLATAELPAATARPAAAGPMLLPCTGD